MISKKLESQGKRKDISKKRSLSRSGLMTHKQKPLQFMRSSKSEILFFKHSICSVTPENGSYFMALLSWLLFWNAKCFISIAWVCLCKKLISCHLYQHNESLFRKFVIQSKQYYGPCVLLCFVSLLFWIAGFICCWFGFEKRQMM